MSKYERKAQSQRKHGPLSISGAPKAPAPPPVNRPEWRGPGNVKKQPSRHTPSKSTLNPTIQEQTVSIKLQQSVLATFCEAFPAAQDFETLKPTLRVINDALSQNDLTKAFGDQKCREAYTIRWSPSRSLTYANILAWICNQHPENGWVRRLLHITGSQEAELPENGVVKVICFGGGPAELMAFAALLRHTHNASAGKPGQSDFSESALNLDNSEAPPVRPTTRSPLLDIHLIDAADWSSVTSSLHHGLTTPPMLSTYASATARAANAAMLSESALRLTFIQRDLLGLGITDLRDIIGRNQTMLTLFLTLSDLFTTSIPRTTNFLRKVTVTAPKGSFLLVVESPGASIDVTLPGAHERQADVEKKTYNMQWFLDRVLLGKIHDNDEQSQPESMWEKVVDENNRHHRLEEKLEYPASLENMKFQLHLFVRL